MFEIFGYLLGLIVLAILVTLLTEYTKRFKFIAKLTEWFISKIKFISWYQFEAILIAVIILIILNLLNAASLGFFALILNAIVIGLLANGIFTYPIVKSLLLKFKITKIIEIIETKTTKRVAKK